MSAPDEETGVEEIDKGSVESDQKVWPKKSLLESIAASVHNSKSIILSSILFKLLVRI